jgi:hypothetical protein
MSDERVKTAKDILMQCVRELTEIAERNGKQSAVGKLLAQQRLLEGLDARIERSNLPDRFIRSVVNDIRLDVMMIYADVKLFLTFKKQEGTAPTAKIKQEASDRLRKDHEAVDSAVASKTSDTDALPEIGSMFSKLKSIEELLNECRL